MPISPNKKFIFLLLAIALPAAILSFISPASAIGFFLLAIFIFISIKKPIWIIYAMAFYIPFEPFALKFASNALFPFLKYGFEVGILILFAIVVGRYFFCYPQLNTPLPAQAGLTPLKGGQIKTPIDKPLLIFIIITAISALINFTNPLYWILGLRQLFRFTLLYYTIIYLKISKDKIKKLVIIILSLLIIQSAIGIGQAIVGKQADKFLLPDKVRDFGEITTSDFVEQSWSSGQRVFATMGRYDRLGTFLCFTMLICLGFFIETKNKKYKKIYLALIIMALPALILTYSRMSWLGFGIGLCFMAVILKKDKIITTSIIFALCLFLIYTIFYIANNNILINRLADKSKTGATERFLMLFSSKEFNGSYKGYGRLYFIINTPMKVIKNYPLFGVGLGRYGSGVASALNNREIYDKLNIAYGIQDYLGSIDNNWLSLWGETGTLGVIAFLCIIINLFIYSYKFYKNSDDDFSKSAALGFLGVIIAISFQSFLGQYFEVRPLSFYFWLIAGMVVSLNYNICEYSK